MLWNDITVEIHARKPPESFTESHFLGPMPFIADSWEAAPSTNPFPFLPSQQGALLHPEFEWWGRGVRYFVSHRARSLL